MHRGGSVTTKLGTQTLSKSGLSEGHIMVEACPDSLPRLMNWSLAEEPPPSDHRTETTLRPTAGGLDGLVQGGWARSRPGDEDLVFDHRRIGESAFSTCGPARRRGGRGSSPTPFAHDSRSTKFLSGNSGSRPAATADDDTPKLLSVFRLESYRVRVFSFRQFQRRVFLSAPGIRRLDVPAGVKTDREDHGAGASFGGCDRSIWTFSAAVAKAS